MDRQSLQFLDSDVLRIILHQIKEPLFPAFEHVKLLMDMLLFPYDDMCSENLVILKSVVASPLVLVRSEFYRLYEKMKIFPPFELTLIILF